jgi:predicted CXXCH cytochrome family protein
MNLSIKSKQNTGSIFKWSVAGIVAAFVAIMALLLVVPTHSTFSKGKSCVDCHKEIKQLISKKKAHDPAKESCETCHRRHGFKQELVLVKALPELCIDCHEEVQDEVSGKEVHGALSQGGCTICHDPHASDKKWFLRETENAQPVCILCHDNLSAAINADESHRPFKNGDCAECHAAHSSEHENLMIDSESAVCARCHEGAAAKHSMPGAEDYSCADCHDPHMATKKTPFASYAHEVFAAGDCESCHTLEDGNVVLEDDFPPDDLCSTCHDEQAEHIEGSDSHFGENELKNKGTATCLQCHDPHTSRIASLAVAEQDELCRSCHEELPVKDGFEGIMHSPFAEGSCTTCHNPHGGGGDIHLADSPQNICSNCHGDYMKPLQEGEIRHGAFEVAECIECHHAHGSRKSPLLKKQPHALCFDCHDKEEHAVAHSPYVNNVCTACHKNHSSKENLLVNTLDNVCARCHSNTVLLSKNASVLHPPAKEESCDFCHLPHGSENQGLLTSAQDELCASCHDLDALLVTFPGDNTDGSAAQAGSESMPVNQGGRHDGLHAPFAQSACEDCHNPHGSNHNKLLKRQGADLCYGCHAEKKLDFEKGTIHKPVKDGACLTCHTPHGGTGEALTVKPQPDLCIQCHDFSLEPLKRVHKGFDVTGTICTTCHNPHNGPDENLLKEYTHDPFVEGSCDDCHEDFAARDPEAAGTSPAMKAVEADICLVCHDDMTERQGHQHIENLQCINCHSPHASKYEKLLENPKTLCLKCHEDILHSADGPDKTHYTHKPIERGSCLNCHQLHDPKGQPLLVENQKDLCASCHASVKERTAHLTQHVPFRDGNCEKCHKTHSSTEAHLLRAAKTELCKTCHEFNSNEMKASHKGLPLTGKGCTTCHDPHSTAGSNSKLMLSVLHAPYEEGECSACHEETGAPPVSSSVCMDCHGDGDEFAAVHSGGKSKSEAAQTILCLDCHSPHAGYEVMLKRSGQEETCLQCHDRSEFGKTYVHGALELGCTTCHDVHNSNFGDFAGEKLNALCAECHEKAMEHAHPIGDEYLDPRTDEPLTCLSCHESHSSDHDKILVFDQRRDLCIQCHSTGK